MRKPKTTNPDDITARTTVLAGLRAQGLRVKDVAQLCGISPQCASQVFWRHYPRVERKIALMIEQPVQAIWPHRYATGGKG